MAIVRVAQAPAPPVNFQPMNDLTRILSAVDAGDPHAPGKLLPLVYDELRRLAAHRLASEHAGHTLQPTALVHEAYLRLVDVDHAQRFGGRGHFFAAAAEAMRRILVDSARRRHAQKRGGGRVREDLDALAAPEPDDDLLALDEALKTFAATDPVKARLVELRYFGGLTNDQAAEVLGISPSTADRHWSYARAWLQAAVRGA
jgi:RNA polymerase sigma factor (TIGR02999 family)